MNELSRYFGNLTKHFPILVSQENVRIDYQHFVN
jgi:hypothetical protein